MDLKTSIDGNMLIVSMTGDLTFFNVGKLIATIKLITEGKGLNRVSLMANAIPMIDSRCLRCVDRLARTLKEQEGCLFLINANHGIVNAMHRIRMQEILPSFDTIEQAVSQTI